MESDRKVRYFLTAGAGDSEDELNAFDIALLNAKIGNCNLVKISSILPPGAEKIEPYEIGNGEIIYVAYGAVVSHTKGEQIAAAIGVGVPEDETKCGLIMEHAAPGDLEEMKKIVKRKVEQGMKYRGYKIRDIYITGIEHITKDKGAVFAGAVLLF